MLKGSVALALGVANASDRTINVLINWGVNLYFKGSPPYLGEE